MRVRHSVLLLGEVVRLGGEQRMWWLAPTVAILLVAAVLISAAATALPVTVYALF